MLQIITRCGSCGYGFRAKARDGSLFTPAPKVYRAICPKCFEETDVSKFIMVGYDSETEDMVGTTI